MNPTDHSSNNSYMITETKQNDRNQNHEVMSPNFVIHTVQIEQERTAVSGE